MKKSMMLTAVAVAAMTATCMGQTSTKKLSLFADVGYGFGIGGEYFGSSIKSEDGSTMEVKDKFLNYGRGLKIGAGASYNLLDNFAARLSVAFSAGVPRATIQSESVDHPANGVVTTTTVDEKARYSQLGFRLMGIPRFTVADLFDLYFGAGLGLYFSFRGEEASSEIRSSVATTQFRFETKTEYKNLPSFAFLGAVGGEIPLNDMLNVYAEVGFDAMTVIMKERTVRRYNAAGSVTNTDHEVYERNDIHRGENTSLNPNKAPGTNWGLKLGVRIPIL